MKIEKELLAKTIAFNNGYRDAFNPCDNDFENNSFVQQYVKEEKLSEILEKEKLKINPRGKEFFISRCDNKLLFTLKDEYSDEEELIAHVLYKYYEYRNNIDKKLDPSSVRLDSRDISVQGLIEKLGDIAFIKKNQEYKVGIIIESLLIKIPVSPVLIDSTEDNKILTGKEVLRGIMAYVDNRFTLTNLQFLRGLEHKTFDELPRNYQRRILESYIKIYYIEKGTPAEVRDSIVERFNLMFS